MAKKSKKRFMSKSDVVDMLVAYFPSHLRSRQNARVLDSWMNGDQYRFAEELDADHPGYGRAYSPSKRGDTEEYENLRSLAPNNFAGLVVATLAQTAYLEGIRRPGTKGALAVWATFQRNRWSMKQGAVHRGAIGQGAAFGLVLPGEDPLTGGKLQRMIGKSAIAMSAYYDNDDDEWAVIAIEAEKRFAKNKDGLLGVSGMQTGWTVKVYDAYVVHRVICNSLDGSQVKDWEYVDYEEHGIPVPPVARCVNRMDLEGRTRGEIEPVLPLLRRVDQDLFDRLINQRFGAWQVRYIAGMAKPAKPEGEDALRMKLRIEDLLVSTNKDTKFGVIPAGPLEPQIAATDADLRLLAAITQTPPHHLLGLSSNLQAEALAAAEAGLQRKSFDFKTNAAEFHEQMARLVALGEGDTETAAAWDLQVRWKDTESRSFSQAVQALGMLATQLGVPIEMLWERVPGWTDTDVQRAKELVEDGSFEAMIQALIAEKDGSTPEKITDEPGGDAVIS